MKTRHLSLLLFFVTSLSHAQTTSENNARLKEGLKRYPEADTNKDGILTMEEGLAYLAKRKAAMPTGNKGETTPPKAGGLTPDAADVAYGPHERNRLDVYLTKNAKKPTPMVVLIHGGGFRNGDKNRWANEKSVSEFLKNGVSCAAINYPFIQDKPIQEILQDCARAVQYLRANAEKWNLDKTRFAAMGGSAGAGASIWLATRDDLADPQATDPVLRESSRILCAVCNSTQATYNLARWPSFLGPLKPEFNADETEAALFYHLPSIDAFQTDSGKAILRECDMLSWISKDDPPVLLNSTQVVEKPTNRGEWLHCILHARAIQKHYSEAEASCILLQDEKGPKPTPTEFILQHLTATASTAAN